MTGKKIHSRSPLSDIPMPRYPDIPISRLCFRHKPCLVSYLTCGERDLATTREVILAAISAGADVIELGVPFSDPVDDGPVLQRAREREFKNGTSLQDVLSLA